MRREWLQRGFINDKQSVSPFSPLASAWVEGWVKGFSSNPPLAASDAIDAASSSAFNLGIVAGEQSAANGIECASPCISVAEEHSGEPAVVEFEITSVSLDFLHAISHGLAGLFVFVIELAVSLPHRAEDPAQVLPPLGDKLMETLGAFGLSSWELFVGAGIDPIADGCEIRVTPLFKSADQAREAVMAMGRTPWIVASWRTDMSNSFKIVDSSPA